MPSALKFTYQWRISVNAESRSDGSPPLFIGLLAQMFPTLVQKLPCPIHQRTCASLVNNRFRATEERNFTIEEIVLRPAGQVEQHRSARACTSLIRQEHRSAQAV